ncbi:type II CRISPR RNA-guided endonuclease Cas9 [Vagococcus silagei]|uniref:CRISPR-associated endonuclease Cas9 n=1 Tax=Vagococcus silagei TaxID=2508885 RepID=A0A4S3B6J9_9ENTE|nr:type II CRISPR RNA-guided endonuclease Cas9 [Vagococcus silagei]THB60265.1 type II CRISPR RNA-guided endonuclease Cas9 [Vagococcus silagei]
MRNNYTIGLDIGTNSVGWAVVKDNLDLVKRKMPIQGNTDQTIVKKNFWGVRLFDEGQTAEDRRMKRVAKRRYIRRRQRILYLQDIFTPEMKAFDPAFFHRLDESFIVSVDKTEARHPIFGTLEEEVAYHNDYPTIYHLRKTLADSKEKADLRLIYLAIAHIMKFRGHFLIEGNLNAENSSVEEAFSKFLNIYNDTFLLMADNFGEQVIINQVDTSIKIEKITKLAISRAKKADLILKEFDGEKSNGTFAQFIKLIVGNQGNFKKTFGLENDVKLQLSKETYEEERDELLSLTSDVYADLFTAAKNVYDAIELSSVLKTEDRQTRAKLSASMIERYTTHKEDLADLKNIVKNNAPEKYGSIFNDSTINGYAGYIDGEKVTQEMFYKYLKKELGAIDDFQSSLEKIDKEIYLRKQRTFDNGVIPHQIHLIELEAILERQGEFYPFLKENTEKICQIFKFRIPYYVGPLAKNSEQSQFAWLTRKSNEPIRPWNFSEVVDEFESSKQFIERMTNFDMYLPTEKVLPKHSLLYQKYTIFNELTKVTYKNEQNIVFNFSGDEKQEIFEKLFKYNRKVSKKALLNFLENEYQISGVSIASGIETSFNAHLGTYHDLLKLKIDRAFLDDPKNEDIIEDIVKILTIFEDRKMIREQLKSYENIFSAGTLKAMERRHYTGWGRLSKELIHGIIDRESGKTILDFLMEDDGVKKHTNRNLMQLINDPLLSFKEEIMNRQLDVKQIGLEETVHKLPGSPAIKKGILQSLKVVDELVSIMGYDPKAIVVEMARENQRTNRKSSRLKQLEKLMADMQSSLLKDNPTTNEALRDNRLFLYYLQNGKDMYTEDDLNISSLSQYDLDHIIPQSFIKDDSLDNLVLVSSSKNRGKLDDVPSEDIVRSRKRFWQTLKDSGLISERKFMNLTKGEHGGLTEADREGFIKRQLVETRQITKHVAQILDQRFNPEKDENDQVIRNVDILSLKSALTSQFRKDFKLYKVRDVNDYHHAHDAYLNVVVGNTLVNVYPQLKSEFVYGEYNKKRIMARFSATEKREFYGNIMKFFKSNEPRKTDSGEVLWSQRDVAQVKKVLNYRQMNIVKKVERQKGQLTKESVFPSSDSNKLIPIKKNLETIKYGGFKEIKISFTVLISSIEKNARLLSLVGIPIRDVIEYEKDRVVYLKNIGRVNPIIIRELPKYSLFELSDGRKRFLASANEIQRANQIVLSDHLNKLMYYSVAFVSGDTSVMNDLEKLRDSYAELLDVILNFDKKYTMILKDDIKIRKTFEANKYCDIAILAKAFTNLIKLTQVGGSTTIEFLDVKIPRKQYRSVTDIRGIIDGVLIDQSITGLFESKWKFEG